MMEGREKEKHPSLHLKRWRSVKDVAHAWLPAASGLGVLSSQISKDLEPPISSWLSPAQRLSLDLRSQNLIPMRLTFLNPVPRTPTLTSSSVPQPAPE